MPEYDPPSSDRSERLKPLKKALDPAICQKASRYAIRVYEEMSKRSLLLAEETDVPGFDRDDIMVRRVCWRSADL
jgi:hypothetical protein